MPNILFKFIITVIATITITLSSFAAINSTGEIQTKVMLLNILANNNYYNYINKSELVGERLQKFDMLNAQYKNDIMRILAKLNSQIDQVKTLENSSDTASIKKVYNEANSLLLDLDSQTIKYLSESRGILPSLTYQKYSKNFCNFYNKLNISGTKIVIK